MDPRISKLEYSKIYNSLASVPVILLNKNTIIDLWNETSVAGTIQDVDGFMNITMTNVVFIDQQGQMRPLENFFILARNIKFIHIPKEIDVTRALERLYYKKSNEAKNKRPSKTFKLKRAQLNHLQTLREISAQNDEQEGHDNESLGTSTETTS
ncbi:U7 snRNA-associated Sm-like protein LSm10 [Sitodiplosis mosellana]|uniref:U7 snRNA-associated Sm-like protein LSm10 n=1 Tax=Sitodiplosis mosellana TaxID=263140 RepID=UPI002444CE20|nr:U7 snRNA-associated Sm-like protein LSm10 [Sitodiplosis mosellana]